MGRGHRGDADALGVTDANYFNCRDALPCRDRANFYRRTRFVACCVRIGIDKAALSDPDTDSQPVH